MSDKIFRIHLQSGVSPRFLAIAFASQYVRHQIEQAISGAEGLANNLPQSSLKSFTIAVPPINEQAGIVTFVEAEKAKLTALTAEAKRAIQLLKEHRSALITAAVTGRVDVREATRRATQPPEEPAAALAHELHRPNSEAQRAA